VDSDKVRAGKTRLNAGLVRRPAKKRGRVGEVGSLRLIVTWVVLVLALVLVY
jgi:hypothetical protein